MAQWPTSVATDSSLYICVNILQTTLNTAAGAADTSIVLASASRFPGFGVVLIDSEIIQYSGISGNTLTGCIRGFDGTTANTHAFGAVVAYALVADHLNILKNEIEAIETYLSNNLGLNAQPLVNGHRALASSAAGKITEQLTTDTELGYVHGVTSALQIQLNTLTSSKVAKAGDTMSGALNMGSNQINALAAPSVASDAATKSYVDTALSALLPSGAILDFGGTSAPAGFLLCDGSAVSRTTYAALFTAISTTWGVGDGSTTFNLPDFRRRTSVGSGGTGSGTLGNAVGNTGGEETHTLLTAEMPSHSHSVTDPQHSHTLAQGQTVRLQLTSAGGSNGGGTTGLTTQTTTDAASTGISLGNTGSGTAHNNIQPSAVVTKIIKT
jgi:microcystin-dependent protein